jgi:hypothetical protein
MFIHQVRSDVVVVSSRVVARTVFVAIEAVPDLLLALTVALTMTASSGMRLELFRVATGRSSPSTRLYWCRVRLINDIARGRWRKQRLINIRGASVRLKATAFNEDTMGAIH